MDQTVQLGLLLLEFLLQPIAAEAVEPVGSFDGLVALCFQLLEPVLIGAEAALEGTVLSTKL